MVDVELHIGAVVEFGLYEGDSGRYAHSNVTMAGRSPLTLLASGLYALAFGLLGLIPAPKVHRH